MSDKPAAAAKVAPAKDAADPNPKAREDKATPTPGKLRKERVDKTVEGQKEARAALLEKKRRWARSSHSKRYTFYHLPECEKAVANLKFLKDEGIKDDDIEVVEYMKTTLTKEQWKEISDLLNKSDGGGYPRKMLRTKETGYAESGLDDEKLSEDQILEILTKSPQFFQRPVLVDNKSGKAVMGRPQERVKEVIGKKFTLYYLPECEKAEQNLKTLKERGIKDEDLEVVEYMKASLTKAQWGELSDLLNDTKGSNTFPREMVRTKQDGYAESGLDDPKLSRDQILEVLANKPQFFQRPVLVNNRAGRAVLGRPVERIFEIL